MTWGNVKKTGPVGLGTAPRTGPTGFGDPTSWATYRGSTNFGEQPGERAAYRAGTPLGNTIIWTFNGEGYTVADVNQILAAAGYSWQVPTNLTQAWLGSADHKRLQNQISLVQQRTASGQGPPGFDIDGSEQYGPGIGMYSDWINEGRPGSGGGGGRYGGGAMADVYIEPDMNEVEDLVKSYVVAVTGTLRQGILDGAIKVWLDADRKNFDNPNQDVNPNAAVKEFVRGTDIYKHVHQLRPESVDEMQWVTGRQGQLRQLGLSAELAERVGIDMSEVGAAGPATQRGGEMAQVGATGRLLSSQRERLKGKASAALALV